MTLDLEHDFTFNPDGSGRVTVCWRGPVDNAPPPDDFVRGELERARGVDTWADVSCQEEGGALVFRGTAWFRDVQALRFHCQGFHVSALDFAIETHDDGSITLASVGAAKGIDTTTLPEGATADEIAAALAAEREKLAMARGFLDGLFGSLTCRAILRLPAPIAGRGAGKRIDARTLEVSFAGQQLVALLDRLATDDALMTRLLRQGGLSPESAMELLGEQGPIRVRTAPDAAPQFDYDAEVAAAAERFAEFAASLAAAVPSGAPAEAIDGARIVAAKVVLEADSERDLCPQGQNQPGVTLTIAIDLPQPALEVEDTAYDRTVAGDGTDFTPSDEWDRRSHFPKLTKDGRTAVLEFGFAPPAGSAGLREFTGHFTALCSDGGEAIDLGFPELAAGTAGSEAGAQLLRCDVDGEGNGELEVQLQVARQRVLGGCLVGGGEERALDQAGYSSCNDECTLTWRFTGGLPPDARVVLTFATALSRRTFAFTLRDVDWFGRPIR
jgi:hypothetical protein